MYTGDYIEEDEEDEEINEERVNNMVQTFVNTFKRNLDLWSNFKNVVDRRKSERKSKVLPNLKKKKCKLSPNTMTVPSPLHATWSILHLDTALRFDSS